MVPVPVEITVLNAVQASSEGSTVSVKVDRKADSSEAMLTVTDSGPGFDESDAERLFEPFFSTRSTGSGLGLAIVKAIVEKHGGTVTLDNLSQGGAVATLRLPVGDQK